VYAKAGLRGGIVAGWKIPKLTAGSKPQVLSRDAETRSRFETDLNGWALYEGYAVQESSAAVAVEALVARDVRKTSRTSSRYEPRP
jgi:hypothetical protein